MMTAARLAKAAPVTECSHLIGAFVGDSDGPTLIAIGSLHGNEPAGAIALEDVYYTLEELEGRLNGRVFLVAGNMRALEKRVRFINDDLNRAWTRPNISSVGTPSLLISIEGRELTELDRLLDSILITARSEVFVVDLHSTSARGAPFATVGDTMRNRRFARKFPVKTLLGIEEQLEGTLLEYLNNAGAVTLGFEGGQHESPTTVENHVAFTLLALVNAGIVSPSQVPDLDEHELRLSSGVRRGSHFYEVIHREAIKAEDDFEMRPGFTNFDPIKKDQVLAENKVGPVRASRSGVILMPLYQKLGDDGFFIGQRIAPFWLGVSAILRRLKVPNIVHWLPGVWRDPTNRETVIVNTRVARIFPLQIFHLLGFRKLRWSRGQLVVSRRRHDTTSPFMNNG
jgi:predicted deacylase